MKNRNCIEHQFRESIRTGRSIGTVSIETCNNCLSVVVIQKRDVDEVETRTVVEMKDSSYCYE